MSWPGNKKLRSNERGAAVIEMAMIAPVFALMVIGIVDISNAYSRKLALEQGAQRAIEKIMQTTQQDTVENTLATEAVCQVDGTNSDGTCKASPITTSNVTVTWRRDCTTSGGTVTTYTDTGSASFDTYVNANPCATGSKQSTYIQIGLTDQYTPLFPIHFSEFTSSDGTYHLSATAGMRTS